jgi:hypothetical protein
MAVLVSTVSQSGVANKYSGHKGGNISQLSFCPCRGMLSSVALHKKGWYGPYLSVSELLQIHLQRLDVVFEAQSVHCPQQIIAVDGLALLSLTLVAGPAGSMARSCYFYTSKLQTTRIAIDGG